MRKLIDTLTDKWFWRGFWDGWLDLFGLLPDDYDPFQRWQDKEGRN